MAIQAAARILNLKLEVLEVQNRADLEAAFPPPPPGSGRRRDTNIGVDRR